MQASPARRSRVNQNQKSQVVIPTRTLMSADNSLKRSSKVVSGLWSVQSEVNENFKANFPTTLNLP